MPEAMTVLESWLTRRIGRTLPLSGLCYCMAAQTIDRLVRTLITSKNRPETSWRPPCGGFLAAGLAQLDKSCRCALAQWISEDRGPSLGFDFREIPSPLHTFPKTSSSSLKWMLQDHPFPFGMSHFQGRTVKLQGLISTKLWECRLAPSLQYGGPILQNTYIQGIMQKSLVILEGNCSDDKRYHVCCVLFPSRSPSIDRHVNNPVTKHHMATTNNFGSFESKGNETSPGKMTSSPLHDFYLFCFQFLWKKSFDRCFPGVCSLPLLAETSETWQVWRMLSNHGATVQPWSSHCCAALRS